VAVFSVINSLLCDQLVAGIGLDDY
jgi:hypothetical protein